MANARSSPAPRDVAVLRSRNCCTTMGRMWQFTIAAQRSMRLNCLPGSTSIVLALPAFSKATLPPMVNRRRWSTIPHLRTSRGVIVNIIDIHAKRPLRDHAVYGVAKAGLAMLTRSLARDLAPDIRVNGVAPGAIAWPENDITDATKENILRQIPLGRSGDPADIANCVLFLVRDATYSTGQIIVIDGGRSLGW